MSDDLNDLISSFYRGFVSDFALFERTVTPDWEDSPLAPGQEDGPAGIIPIVENLTRTFADFAIVVHDLVDGRGPDGNGSVGVRAEVRGRHVGEFFGIPGTEKQISIALYEFHEVQEGRIRRTWHLEDWLGFFMQVERAPQIGTA